MPPTPVLATSRAQGFHPDPLEEPPSRIVRTGRRRSEPPHMAQTASAISDLSGGHNPHGADPTTRPSMPPPPIRGQMVCRRRPGRRRRTQPRPLPEAGPAAAPATIRPRPRRPPRRRRSRQARHATKARSAVPPHAAELRTAPTVQARGKTPATAISPGL